MKGLGVGAIAFDWATVSSYLLSPLSTPFFAIANVFAGFLFVMYVITPIAYYNNLYSAKKFPIFSGMFFRSDGQRYDINKVIDENFALNEAVYDEYGQLHLSTFFAFTYGVGFAALTATLSHVILFHGWYYFSQFPLMSVWYYYYGLNKRIYNTVLLIWINWHPQCKTLMWLRI